MQRLFRLARFLSSKKGLLLRSYLAGALCLGAGAMLHAEPDSLIVRGVESPVFSAPDLARYAEVLGIEVGNSLDPRHLDRGIRQLYDKNEVQTLFVEAVPREGGVLLVLRGEKVRILRQLRFTNVDSAVLDEVRHRQEVKEGSPTSMRAFALLRERIRDAYERRGYNFADVQIVVHDIPESKQADVEVLVQPNQPTKVTHVAVIGGTPAEDKILGQLVSLRVGDRFSQARLDESSDAINHYLRNNQYPTSKVEDTILKYTPDKLEVSIQILVKLGKRFQFQFSGNRVFSDAELRALLTPEILSQSDATEKIAALVENKYREIGYYFCKARPQSIIDEVDKINIIRFQIAEGHRVIIDKVEFTGGDELGHDTLENLFFDNAQGVLARHIYWEDGIADALREVTKRLQAMGYLHPNIAPPKTVFSEDRKGVQLFFDADLGPRTYISRVEISGAKEIPLADLEALMPFRVGEPLDRDKIRAAREAIKSRYQAEGYEDVKIVDKDGEYELSRDQKQAVIPIHIDEGKRYRVGTITLEGNQKTRREVILREMKVQTGDYYDPVKVTRSEQDIRLLGLFSRADIVAEPDPGDPNKRNLHIVVHETDPGLGEVGAGAVYEDPRLRVRGLAGLSYRNLMGLDQTISLNNQISLPLTGSTGPLPFIEYSSILGYRAPRPFDLPLDFSAQAGISQFEVSVEGPTLQTTTQITGIVQKKLSDALTFRYRLYRLERDRTETLSPRYVVENTIGSTGPGFVLDRRDDAFNPHHGSYHIFDVELAHPLMLSAPQTAFFMAISRNSFYIPLISPLRFILFAGGGYASSLNSTDPLPTARLVKDLALGGQTSIRGFLPRRFYPQEGSVMAGYYNVRGEINMPIFLPDLLFAVFYDTGQIFSNSQAYLRHDGIGVGLRYKTPVGPVVVDIAQGLGPDREAVKFYFTVGTM